MTWLVTGGAGFIGSNLVHRLVQRHPERKILVLDALTYAGNLSNLAEVEGKPNYEFVRGDICDGELIEKLFVEHGIEGVFHLAAESHVDRSILDSGAFIRTNVQGTWTLLETARRHWMKHGECRGRFLHVSTDEVYGSLGPDDPAFSEKTPYSPNSPYSASKAASDHLARAWHHTHGLDVVTTNCSNNFGPWQFPEKLIPVMICNALEGKPLPVYGDGMNVRDWLYVEDHCEALERVFEKGRAGEVYNIGGGNEVPNLRLVEQICDLLDEICGEQPEGSRRRLISFVKDRPGHDRRYAIDSRKISGELGWKPAHDFTEALKLTIRWNLDHADWLDRCRSGKYREYFEKNYLHR